MEKKTKDFTLDILQILLSDLERVFCSWKFWITVLMIPIIMYLNISETLQLIFENKQFRFVGAMEKIMEILIFDRFKGIMVVLLSSLFCSSISEELNSRFLRMALIRVSIKRYVFSKIIVNALSVIAATVLGFFLFTVLSSPFMSIVGITLRSEDFGYFQEIIDSPMPWMYAVLVGMLFGMFIVFLTTVSLWISVYHPDKYLTLAAPVCLFYILYAVTTIIPIQELNMWYISSGVQVLKTGTSFIVNYLYGMGVFLLLTVAAGYGCLRGMEGRMRYGNI